jgi:hypothetical protein
VVVVVVFAFMVGGLPYVIVKDRRRRARQMAEPMFDHLEPIDLDDE